LRPNAATARAWAGWREVEAQHMFAHPPDIGQQIEGGESRQPAVLRSSQIFFR